MSTVNSINALLLAENESSMMLDRKVLRRLGVTQSLFFASGAKAITHMKEALTMASVVNGTTCPPLIDMLICNERLEDMTGLQFLAHVRSLAGMADIPAVLLVGNARSTVAIAARATNSCAVLARPYSPDQAREVLHFATLPEARHTPMILPPSFANRFSAAAGTRRSGEPLLKRTKATVPGTPGETALHEGLKALQRGDATAADVLLHGSYEADPGRVETCLALSRLYAFLHKEKEEFMWLCRAGVLCLKRGETSRARDLFGRLPRGRAGQAPLLAEAGLVLQAGEIKAAALSFLEAHRLEPTQALHSMISRTCMFTPAPEEHMRDLIKALAASGHGATASKLHWRLLQPQKEMEEEEDSFLARFPMLYDIICVATHTFKTWRHAA